MIHPDTYLKTTPKGLGLFAKQRFGRGTILWIADDIDAKIPLVEYLTLDEVQRRKNDTFFDLLDGVPVLSASNLRSPRLITSQPLPTSL